MPALLHKLPFPSFWLPILLVTLGFLLAGTYFAQPVQIIQGATVTTVRGLFLTPAQALQAAQIPLYADDRLEPPLQSLLRPGQPVRVLRAAEVIVWNATTPTRLNTHSRVPAQWLAEAGYPLYPRDQVSLDGTIINPLLPLAGDGPFVLRFAPCQPFTLADSPQARHLWACQSTVGDALAENDVLPEPGDRLEPDPASPFQPGMTVTLHRARPFTVHSGGKTLALRSSAATVGAALAQNGLAPGALDSTIPSPDQPLPSDGQITLLRGAETVLLEPTLTPYESSSTFSAEIELDTTAVVQAGQAGVELSRVRVHSVDGQELRRASEGSWIAALPREQILARGTRAVVQSLDIGGTTLEYYRAVTVYATSYSPCRQGLGRCTLATSSGIPLAKGVVAVTLSWYRQFAGSQVYIPGYGIGTIADVGGGIPGRYWIDLGFSEEDFELWHQDVTLYFLTPVPANVPAVLP